MPSEYRLRILHLSDLHERVALAWMPETRKAKVRVSTAGRRRVLEESNFQDVIAQIRKTGEIDLVCFTGDIADWGLAEEYKQATERFNRILAACGVSHERLFLVPGNHDVQRQQEEEAWRKLRELAATNASGLSNWMAGMEPPFGAQSSWRGAIVRRTAAFWSWVESDLRRPCLLPGGSPHPYLGYQARVDGLDFPFDVHVTGLDSAWLCGDNNDAGKLRLTEGQVDLLTRDSEGRPLSGFRLALVHHPLSDLADGMRCFQLLSMTTDLLMHGHQHEPIAEVKVDPDRQLRVLAAGSLYEGDEGDRWINSFHTIDVYLDDEGRPLRYRVAFWGWSERGHWYPTGAIYRAALDGILDLPA